MKNEKWAINPIWECEASNLGRIRRNGRILSAATSHDRHYVRVKVRRTGEVKRVNVAKLVLTAFVGPRPTNMTIEHLDQDKSNDRLHNLCWMPLRQNIKRNFMLTSRQQSTTTDAYDKYSHDLIERLWATGDYSQLSIYKMTGVHNSTISKIVNNIQCCVDGPRRCRTPTAEELQRYKKKPLIDREEILRLRAMGWNCREIAHHVGCGMGYVYEIWSGRALAPSRREALLAASSGEGS